MAVLLIAVIALLAVACGCKQKDAAQSQPKNIIVIVWDSVGAKHMSLYGYDKPTTPKLENWARKGRVFEDCLAPAAAGTMAYASLLTGLLPTAHGNHYRNKYLESDLTTIAEYLKTAGYQTYIYSAHPLVSRDYNFDQGFDRAEYVWDAEWRVEAREYVRSKVPLGDLSSEASRRIHMGQVSDWILTAAGEFGNRALLNALAGRDKSTPFFAFVNYTEAHRPLLPSMEHRSRVMTPEQVRRSKTVERLRMNVWKFSFGAPIFDDADLEVLTAMYDATICELDDLFDELMTQLEQSGYLDDTIVFLVADHGELQGEHHMLGNDYNLYQPVLHVPLIVWSQDRFPAGTDEHPVMNMDIAPTILELAGVRFDPSTMPHAVSLLNPPRQRLRFAEYPAYHMDAIRFVQHEHPKFDPTPWERSLRCVVNGHMKLIWGSDGRHELYDLNADPNESKNLIHERPKEALRLERAIKREFSGTDSDD